MTQPLHVIFGAGQIGTRVANQLVARGHRVRIVSRSGTEVAGAERVAGDARDPEFAVTAAHGAQVVYDIMNPQYQDWKRDLLTLGRNSLTAATTASARLVALDNLYMYGAPVGPMTEAAPIAPTSRKGALRVELAALRLAALRRGDARVAIARASDFFGPGLPASWWSERFFSRAFAGKRTECSGDPDMPHSYTYADDVARALVTLGDPPDGELAEGTDGVWHVPTVAAETSRQLAARVGKALGLSIAMARMSPLLLRAIGVFSPFMRELPEMSYQWEAPFVLDDGKFRRRFGIAPTPIDEQVATTAAWAERQFGARRAA